MNENQLFEMTKKYHFYAAHRNQNLLDKCRNLHGHTYHLELTFLFSQPTGEDNVTMLFSDVDKFVEPIIKSLDHSMLMDENDPLLPYLQQFEKDYYKLKMTTFLKPTSVETLCDYIIAKVKGTGLPLFKCSIAETTSSIISKLVPVN